jgi:hypothetical protein
MPKATMRALEEYSLAPSLQRRMPDRRVDIRRDFRLIWRVRPAFA